MKLRRILASALLMALGCVAVNYGDRFPVAQADYVNQNASNLLQYGVAIKNQGDILVGDVNKYPIAVPAGTPGQILVQGTGAYPGWQEFGAPVATVVAATTPATTAGLGVSVAVVPTTAASGGVYLPIATPNTFKMIRNAGGNTILVYPNTTLATGTPTYAAINEVAAGTAVSLATVKSLMCFAATSAQWYCTFGQGS